MRGSNIEIFVKGKSHQIIDSMYLGPRSTSQKIFENIFVFAEIFTKKGLFYQFPGMVTRSLCNFLVAIAGGCTISGYSNPEVAQPPGYHTRKLLQ